MRITEPPCAGATERPQRVPRRRRRLVDEMALSSDELSEVRAALAKRSGAAGLSAHDKLRPFVASSSSSFSRNVATLPPPPPPATTPENRRHAQRIRERCNAEVCEWRGNRAGTAFGVVVEDISTTGVGIVHTGRLKVGQQYLLEIPRPRQTPLAMLFTVVRCAERDGGLFDVQVAPDEILSVTADHFRHADVHGAMGAGGASRLRRTMLVAAFVIAVAAVFSGLI